MQHPAVTAARQVVGLYSDPDVTWSIVLALDLVVPCDPVAVAAAGRSLVAEHQHLGRVPVLVRFTGNEESRVLTDLANTVYGDDDPLLRVALSAQGTTLLVAAHHGAVDGLGLLGAAAALVGLPLTSSARGIERTAEPQNFLRTGVGRLVEAALHPPVRLRADVRPATAGDLLTSTDLVVERPSSGALLMAASAGVRAWNGGASEGGRRLLVAMGLSRRPGKPTPAPDRDTAYVRLRAGDLTGTAEAAALIAATTPEPAFPVTDGGGLAPRVLRLLSSRLGSTVLVSNLGLVEHPGLVRVRFWPVPSGPAGTAIGLAGVPGSCTLTVRVRSGWFDEQETAALTAELVGQFTAAAR